MGKPKFLLDNLISSAELSTRCEGPSYVADLNSHQYFQPGGYARVYNGSTTSDMVIHEGEFNATSSLTIEVLVRTGATISTAFLFHKLSGDTGMAISLVVGGILRFYVGTSYVDTSAILSANTIYRIKMVFSAGTLKIYIDGLLIFTATTLPTTITTNTSSITIGSGPGNTYMFSGAISYMSFRRGTDQYGGFANPAGQIAYWQANSQGKLRDISGNGRQAIPFGDMVPEICNSHHVVGLKFPADKAVNRVIIDRRHNLTSSASIDLYGGSWSWNQALIQSATPTPGQPIIFDLASTYTDDYFHLVVSDVDNPDHLVIPPIYIGAGNEQQLQRHFQRGYDAGKFQPGKTINLGGNATSSHLEGPELWKADYKFRLNPTDKAIIDAATALARKGTPFWFTEEGVASDWKLVKLPEFLPGKSKNPKHEIGGVFSLDLKMEEYS